MDRQPAADDEQKKHMAELQQKIKDGVDFGELARKYSIHPSGKEGGKEATASVLARSPSTP